MSLRSFALPFLVAITCNAQKLDFGYVCGRDASCTFAQTYNGSFSTTEKQAISNGFALSQMPFNSLNGWYLLGSSPTFTQIGTVKFNKIAGVWPGHSVTNANSWDYSAINVYQTAANPDGTPNYNIDVYTQVSVNGVATNVPWTNPVFAFNAWLRTAWRCLDLDGTSATLKALASFGADFDLTTSLHIPSPSDVYLVNKSGFSQNGAIFDPVFEFTIKNGTSVTRSYAIGWYEANDFIANSGSIVGTISVTSARYGASSQIGAPHYSFSGMSQQLLQRGAAGGKTYYSTSAGSNPCNPATTYSNVVLTQPGYTVSVTAYAFSQDPIAILGSFLMPTVDLSEKAAPDGSGSPLISPAGYAGNNCQSDLGYFADFAPGT